jgi:two-component system chemotaxis response regulator CheY
MTGAVDFAKLQVLVVEDEEFMRKLTHQLLRELGVETVVSANDGEEGLQHLQFGDTRIDLILCDLQMPKMGGLQLVDAVRSGKANCDADVPIIVLTGHAEEKTVRAALKLHINGYLVKPVSVGSLRDRINAVLTKAMPRSPS